MDSVPTSGEGVSCTRHPRLRSHTRALDPSSPLEVSVPPRRCANLGVWGLGFHQSLPHRKRTGTGPSISYRPLFTAAQHERTPGSCQPPRAMIPGQTRLQSLCVFPAYKWGGLFTASPDPWGAAPWDAGQLSSLERMAAPSSMTRPKDPTPRGLAGTAVLGTPVCHCRFCAGSHAPASPTGLPARALPSWCKDSKGNQMP